MIQIYRPQSMKLPRIKKDAGYFLRVLRAEHNLSQEQAAKRLGVSPSHWSLLEAGKRLPDSTKAEKLAIATGAPLRLFLGLMKEVR